MHNNTFCIILSVLGAVAKAIKQKGGQELDKQLGDNSKIISSHSVKRHKKSKINSDNFKGKKRKKAGLICITPLKIIYPKVVLFKNLQVRNKS